MKNNIIKKILILTVFILCACEKKAYVIFDYNCSEYNNYKCNLKNNKLNCEIKKPVCDGYDFLGWYDENGNKINLLSNFISNKKIIALWKKNNELKSPGSQQIESPGSQQIESPSSQQIESPGSQQIESPGSQQIESPGSQQPTQLIKYIITFNKNNGNNFDILTKEVFYNSTLPNIGTLKPTRKGYKFVGWYDNKNYTNGVQYYNELNTPVRNYNKKINITLYAGWKNNQYVIHYDKNNQNATGTMVNSTYVYDVEKQLAPNGYSLRGYKFYGWNTKKDGTGTSYRDKQKIKNLISTNNETITLYAQWEANILSIRYNGNDAIWNNPTKSAYSSNSEGMVVIKNTSIPYEQKVVYNSNLQSSGLINYNGEWMKWEKNGYYVEKGKEYIISTTELNQDISYSANELASLGGCDLSKQNCTITVKVNWKRDVTIQKDGVYVSLESKSNVKGYYFSNIRKSLIGNESGWINSNKKNIDFILLPGKHYVYIKLADNKILEKNIKVLPSDIVNTREAVDISELHENINIFLEKNNSSVNEFNNTILRSVYIAGPNTREGVAAAALALSQVLYKKYKIKIPYGYNNRAIFGINPNWGNKTTNQDAIKDGYNYIGIHCGGFVAWSFSNANYNMDSGIGSSRQLYCWDYSIPKEKTISYLGSIGDSVTVLDKKTVKSSCKDGGKSGHVGVIVYVTSNGFWIVESDTIGVVTTYLNKNNNRWKTILDMTKTYNNKMNSSPMNTGF